LLFAIARNELYGFFEKRQRESRFDPVLTSIADLKTSPSTRLARRQELNLLPEALQRIPLELGTAPIIGAIAGYVCAWIAKKEAMKHAFALIAVMAVFGAVSAVMESGLRSPWLSVALTVLVSIGVLGGARLWASRMS
jgi:hypothetical protein